MKINLAKLHKLATELYDNNAGVWRTGQAYFNALSELYPEIAELIRATDYDPFYDDKKLIKFFDYLESYNNTDDTLNWANNKIKENKNGTEKTL